MHLDDLGVIPLGGQGGGHALGQGQHKRDPGGEVRRVNHGNPLCRHANHRLVRRTQPGRAKHPGNPCLSEQGGVALHGAGMREVDGDVRTRQRVLDAMSGAGGASEAEPDPFDFLDQQSPHAASAARDGDAQRQVRPSKNAATLAKKPSCSGLPVLCASASASNSSSSSR